ncbi:40S ribosomal protein S9-2 [Artemisia annua]|uniref:40S ribosomal protein S9-2 n=1 Tax=Artemisia annua TaxID=35608 RepID=A0A2U1NNV1_ARTAN|nr:40S ribosomal protein S9-2 [Artemisia annua]
MYGFGSMVFYAFRSAENLNRAGGAAAGSPSTSNKDGSCLFLPQLWSESMVFDAKESSGWCIQYALSRVRNVARMLLTLEEDSRRIFEGEALIRMNRYVLLDES